MSSYFNFLKKRSGNSGNTGNEHSNASHSNSLQDSCMLPNQQTSLVTSGNAIAKVDVLLPAITTQKETVVTLEPNAREVVTTVPSATTKNEQDINYLYNERAGILQYNSELSQSEAERLAYQETLLIYIEERHPTIIETFQNIILNNSEENL